MKVELAPSAGLMLDAFCSEHPSVSPGFCDGARAERARVAADMRRRAKEMREAIGQLREDPVGDKHGTIDKPERSREKGARNLLEELSQETNEINSRHVRAARASLSAKYIEILILQLDVLDKYAEDLERAAT